MRGNELLDKMELIDPAFVEEADRQPVKNKFIWVRWTAMAACICLIVGAVLLWEDESLAPSILNLDIRLPEDTTQAAIEWTELATEPYNSSMSEDAAILEGKPMISGYGESGVNVDMSVTNGGAWYSPALEAAMDHYGDTANYRVLVELFSDGVQIASGGAQAVAEAQRLRELGYIVAVETVRETVTEGDIATVYATYYFTLHVTYGQLLDFQPDGSLGYKFMLYDDALGMTRNSETITYNGQLSY